MNDFLKKVYMDKIGAKIKYAYEKAGAKADSRVKQLIADFHKLPDTVKAKTPLLYWILKSGTPAYKMSPEDSEYVDKTANEEQWCGNCEFLYSSMGKLGLKEYDGKQIEEQKNKIQTICSQVSGDVKLAGWCRLWKKAK